MKQTAYHGLACILLALLLLCGSCSPGTQPANGRQAKIALAAYDAKYTDDELVWLAQHADLLIMHQSLGDKTAFLHSINPDIVLLLYKFSGMSDESAIGHSASGFSSVFQNHKDWFLKDSKGNFITDSYDDWSRQHAYYMDFGNQGWMKYSVDNYLASSAGWDGVFLDVVPLQIKHISPNGFQGYSDDKEFQAALVAYLDYAHSRFAENQKLFIVNGAELIYQDDYVSFIPSKNYWELFLDITDGCLEESFANRYYWGRSEVWQPEERWARQIQAMEYAEEHSKYYIAFSHNRGLNRQDTIYNLGSFLLGAGGHSYFYNMGLEKYRLENFKVDYELFKDVYAVNLGKPIGNMYQEDGLWLRQFEKGLVVVNPDDTSHLLTLDRKMRRFDSGFYQSSFSIGAKEALLLLRK
jgi:hypothetical protein